MGRPRSPLRNRLNPLQKLDSEWKAREAAEAAAFAASLIAFTHVLSALIRFNDDRGALISSDPFALGLFNAMLALIAAVASYVAHRRHPLWLAWVILGWTVLEVLPWITFPLYGHAIPGRFGPAVGLMFVASVLGVRGARALAKGFPQAAEPAA